MGCVKRDVLLLPPALVSTVLANSNMKCADASDGWFGTDGYSRLPLKRLTFPHAPPIPPLPFRVRHAPFMDPISGIEAGPRAKLLF